MIKQIFEFIGYMMVTIMVYSFVGDLISKIPAVVEFKKEKQRVAKIEEDKKYQEFKDAQNTKVTLQPLSENMGEIMYLFSRLDRSPVTFGPGSSIVDSVSGNPFQYSTETGCQIAKFFWSLVQDKNLHCKIPNS